MAIGSLARKDLRLLARDTRSLVVLLAMPLIFILVLGLALGEGFGEKPDDRLRVSIVNLDAGLAQYPTGAYPPKAWSQVVLDDLAAPIEVEQGKSISGVRIEVIPDLVTAERLTRTSQRAAILVFSPDFSARVQRCSFLDVTRENPDPLNPFFRDGVNVKELGLEVLRDPTQAVAASIIEQVAQVTLLRVVMPWMIGRAFDKIADREFIDQLGPLVKVPSPLGGSFALSTVLRTDAQKDAVGKGVQEALQKLFRKYNLQAKTWAELTKKQPRQLAERGPSEYQEPPSGLLQRGALRYQILVPSNTVLFAFFLVLTVGWLFVAERRQGTMVRLRAAPITRAEILLGKLIPCWGLSVAQGIFLFLAGAVVFGMKVGPQPIWLLAVIVSTSAAAVGMAMLVAAFARTEGQVAIYGTLLVLVLAGISGCLMPRELMPETMKEVSRITPHAWALDAYNQLLVAPLPELSIVATACGMLWLFGAAFLVLAWVLFRTD